MKIVERINSYLSESELVRMFIELKQLEDKIERYKADSRKRHPERDPKNDYDVIQVEKQYKELKEKIRRSKNDPDKG